MFHEEEPLVDTIINIKFGILLHKTHGVDSPCVLRESMEPFSIVGGNNVVRS